MLNITMWFRMQREQALAVGRYVYRIGAIGTPETIGRGHWNPRDRSGPLEPPRQEVGATGTPEWEF